MEGCIYCGGPIEDPSPEHVIPRSLGAYDFVIDVCLACNQKANRWVDAPLIQCTTVQRVRADLGMLDERGRPYEVHYVGNVVATVAVGEDHPIQGDVVETFRDGDPVDKPGLKAHVTWNGSELASEMMGAGHSTLSDGRDVHHIYRHEHDDPDDAVYDSDFVPEHFVALVEASRACPHDPQAWERFAAKAGLGLLGALRAGRIPEVPLDDLATTNNQQLVTSRLRALAMPTSPPPRRPQGCEPTGIDGPPRSRSTRWRSLTSAAPSSSAFCCSESSTSAPASTAHSSGTTSRPRFPSASHQPAERRRTGNPKRSGSVPCGSWTLGPRSACGAKLSG